MRQLSAVLVGLGALLTVAATVADAQVYKPYFWGRGGGWDGRFGSDAGEFFDPERLVIDGIGNVWIADVLNHRIQRFSGGGDFQFSFGTFGTGPGQFNSPRGVALDAAGNLYVVDSVNDRIQVFTPDGAFQQEWGGTGTGAGQFRFPNGIAVDGAGAIYVTDGDNHRVQRFSAPGVFDLEWGSFGAGNGQFQFPRGICVDPDSGGVYVVDSFNHRIQRFLADGTLIQKIGRNGGDGTFGSGVGSLNTPRDVTATTGGQIQVADTGNDRIQGFLNGTSSSVVGKKGLKPGEFNTPRGITLYASPNSYYVADSGNHRIQAVGPVTPMTERVAAGAEERDRNVLPLDVERVALGSDPADLTAVVRYQLPEASQVVLEVRDLEGRFVRMLERSARPAGVHTFFWEGADPEQHVIVRAAGPDGERTASSR